MPAYPRPQTTAPAPAPADLSSYGLLERAFQGREYPPVLHDSALARHKSLEVHRSSVPGTFLLSPSPESENLSLHSADADADVDAEEVEETPQDIKASVRMPSTAARVVTPPHLTQTGLPPTPPTMANSDDLEPKGDSRAANSQFADAVRNALTDQTSHAYPPSQQLLTPEPSPPGTTTDLRGASKAMRSSRPRQQTPSGPAPHRLKEYPSSRAESFHTAREDPNVSQAHLSRATSPESHSAAVHQWVEPHRGLRLAGVGLGLQQPWKISTTPQLERQEQVQAQEHADLRSVPPQHNRRRLRSPLVPVRTDSDLDRHVSYISGEDDPGEQPSVEDMNNMIYTQIREDNVKRHSALSSTYYSFPASVVFPHDALKVHKLRRAPKAQSLRNLSASSVISQGDSSNGAPRQLRHKKALTPRSLESSPVFASNVATRRVVAEPVMVSHGMTTKTESFADIGDVPLSRAPQASVGAVDHRVRQHSLRRSPKVDGLDGPEGKLPHVLEQQSSPMARAEPEHTLRHCSAEQKLENNKHVKKDCLGTNGSILSSPRKSLQGDPRFLQPSTTPFSTSQTSDRTEVELCEATAISLYPHKNESLLAIQRPSARPTSKGEDVPTPPKHTDIPTSQQVLDTFLADRDRESKTPHQEDPPPAPQPDPAVQVDSPLTNPRPAPEPPIIHFIPPTPSDELDRQLISDAGTDPSARPSAPRRQESLVKRARRYSESLIMQSLFGRALSGRKPKRAIDCGRTNERPTHLSPLWRPNYIWEGYDSDDDYYDMLDDLEDVPYVPQGGEFSEIVEPRHQQRNSFLPRSMSVRMPGFRGSGGFLLGNSLGLDRHGSNNRRHYVSAKRSTGGLRTNVQGGYVAEVRKTRSLHLKRSEEMLGQGAGKRRVFSLPFSGAKKVQYVSPLKFRAKVDALRTEREEKSREKLRRALRDQITHRRYEGT